MVWGINGLFIKFSGTLGNSKMLLKMLLHQLQQLHDVRDSTFRMCRSPATKVHRKERRMTGLHKSRNKSRSTSPFCNAGDIGRTSRPSFRREASSCGS